MYAETRSSSQALLDRWRDHCRRRGDFSPVSHEELIVLARLSVWEAKAAVEQPYDHRLSKLPAPLALEVRRLAFLHRGLPTRDPCRRWYHCAVRALRAHRATGDELGLAETIYCDLRDMRRPMAA